MSAPFTDINEALRVVDVLDYAGIGVGVTGGWGVDALLGRQTRQHADIDLGVDACDIERAVAALSDVGYAICADQRPARVELRATAGNVDLHPIAWDETGRGVQTGFEGDLFEYPAGSLAFPGSIGGVPVFCATPELQVRFHLGYEPSECDHADLVCLVELFGLALPSPYP